MFALVVRFEVKPGSLVEFDALVEELVPGIRAEEEGTLLYFSSAVSDSPLSRVFVEVYRDEEAFHAHEAQSHTRTFLRERDDLLESYRVEFLRPMAGKFPEVQT
jgi:quinol monooxygenase YgiN